MNGVNVEFIVAEINEVLHTILSMSLLLKSCDKQKRLLHP